jgi:hypothetical protein
LLPLNSKLHCTYLLPHAQTFAHPRQRGDRDKVVLIGKTRMKFRSASVQISYALFHLREIPRFLSTQGARGLLAFNVTLI